MLAAEGKADLLNATTTLAFGPNRTQHRCATIAMRETPVAKISSTKGRTVTITFRSSRLDVHTEELPNSSGDEHGDEAPAYHSSERRPHRCTTCFRAEHPKAGQSQDGDK